MFFIPGVVVGGGGVVVGGGGVPEKNCRRKISKFDAFAELCQKKTLQKADADYRNPLQYSLHFFER